MGNAGQVKVHGHGWQGKLERGRAHGQGRARHISVQGTLAGHMDRAEHAVRSGLMGRAGHQCRAGHMGMAHWHGTWEGHIGMSHGQVRAYGQGRSG
jgi:hypothetical protein